MCVFSVLDRSNELRLWKWPNCSSRLDLWGIRVDSRRWEGNWAVVFLFHPLLSHVSSSSPLLCSPLQKIKNLAFQNPECPSSLEGTEDLHLCLTNVSSSTKCSSLMLNSSACLLRIFGCLYVVQFYSEYFQIPQKSDHSWHDYFLIFHSHQMVSDQIYCLQLEHGKGGFPRSLFTAMLCSIMCIHIPAPCSVAQTPSPCAVYRIKFSSTPQYKALLL